MKTEDLIKAIAADSATTSPPVLQTMNMGLAAAVAVGIAVFAAMLNVRPDFFQAITHDPRFVLKFAFTGGLGIAALFAARRLVRPDGEIGGLSWMFALPIAALVVAVGLEMYAVPFDLWQTKALGTMPGACLKYVPLISVGPLAVILYAMRNGAPSNPVVAGAVAGLLAAGIGEVLYASFCRDDSPMFLAVWYVAGMAIVTGLGAALGARFLKW